MPKERRVIMRRTVVFFSPLTTHILSSNDRISLSYSERLTFLSLYTRSGSFFPFHYNRRDWDNCRRRRRGRPENRDGYSRVQCSEMIVYIYIREKYDYATLQFDIIRSSGLICSMYRANHWFLYVKLLSPRAVGGNEMFEIAGVINGLQIIWSKNKRIFQIPIYHWNCYTHVTA